MSIGTMSTANELLRGLSNTGNKIYGGQHKKEELQREVSVLETMLSNEDTVREVLQQAYNRRPGMALTIPNHLPPKTKEVLAELVLVEDEIARLEAQINRIQKDTETEKAAINKIRTKQTLQNTAAASKDKVLQGTNNNDHQNRPAYDNKALHFISKAISGGGGGYSLTDFTISNDKVASPSASLGNSTPYIPIQKADSSVQQDMVMSKRSGMLKPTALSPLREFRHPTASPMRDFRHPTPKPQERTAEFRPDPPRKAVSGPAKLEETNAPKQQPNKLSENIMKTLILLYVRLIRTSRQSELEKSGPISRSLFSSLSFRTEPGANLSASLVIQKESKQQDPYGVFNIEGAVLRDIGPYKNLVVFSSSSLEPKYVSHSSSIPLFQRLRGLFTSLQKVDLRSLTDQQKLAFWINIYNACIMHGYLKFGVPSSQDKLFNLLNKATLNVGGKVVNAQAIERCILRKPTSSSTNEGEMDTKEATIHELYGLGSVNPNVIFGLCCGTRSSPAVRIYTAEGVTLELEKSKLEYLLASISITMTRKIWLPEMLIQNMREFAIDDMDSVIEWVCNQLPTSGSLRKSIMDCFRGLNNIHNVNRGNVSSVNVEKMSYDFYFQYLIQV